MATCVDCSNVRIVYNNSGARLIRLVGAVSVIGHKFRITFSVNKNSSYATRNIHPASNSTEVNIARVVYVNININRRVGNVIVIILFTATADKE